MNKDRVRKSTFNFNKQLVLGEIGAVIFAPLTAYIASKFISTPSIISGFAVGGSIIGAGIFWIYTRIKDNKSEKGYAKKELFRDMSYFTPAAFLITLLLYYPSLYFLSERFLNNNNEVLISVVFSQFVAFSLFLIGINVYRYFLRKLFGKII